MKLNIVLFEPEIPHNTGNIMRTCVALNATLHLIQPLGFSLDEKAVRRSSANYDPNVQYVLYENFEDFKSKNDGVYYYITRYATQNYSQVDYKQQDEDIYLVFGKESAGLPMELLQDNLDTCLRIPMSGLSRSLNLSNCVSIVAYEVMRQLDFCDLLDFDTQKGIDYLKK